ncbi:MAG: DUF3108 domain-containing protein [Xanthobacteraceae bacterium]
MLPFRLDLQSLVCSAAAIFAFASVCPESGQAQTRAKLEARYSATLAGIPIGRGAWVLDIRDDKYSAAASGSTSGLLRIFASGQGRSMADGNVANGQPVPRRYGATITFDKKTDEVQMSIDDGAVKDFKVNPLPSPNPARVPITEAHRRAITDPMTAALIRVSGNGNPLNPEACQRSSPIFDGRLRYNLKMAFKRMDTVRTDKGYQGPVVVCSVYFSPLAGHIPGRRVIQYLTNLRDMEVWLAPIAGTRVLVPFRISIPTPLGLAILQATQFVTTVKSRPTAANTSSQ